MSLAAHLAVVAAAILLGARTGGVGMGLWGAAGLLVLAACGVVPTAPPVDVMLVVLAVVTAASALEAAGGTDLLVRLADRAIRARPRAVTIVAPLVTWLFTFVAGTGHVVYPLYPVIAATALKAGIRPERPMAVAAIASQQAITASPVSAAMAALVALLADGPSPWGLGRILLVAVPASLAGVLAAALVSSRLGRELDDDPVYRERLAAGLVAAPSAELPAPPPGAGIAVAVFLAAVGAVVAAGAFPLLRTPPGAAPVPMPVAIEIGMLAAGAIMLLLTGTPADAVTRTATMRSGLVALVAIFGLAWLGDSVVRHHEAAILPAIGAWTSSAPWTFGIGLFLASMLLYSQAATTKALFPLGLALGIAPATLVALFPAVNGYFFIPVYGSLVAAVTFDRSGTTRIGRFVLDHSFMIPGLVATVTAVAVGLALRPLVG